MRLCMVTRNISGSLIKWALLIERGKGIIDLVSFLYFYQPIKRLYIMNTNDIENAINHIISLQEKLCYCENNLQYIKRLQALKYWLHKFDSFLDRNSRLHGEYAAVYESYFHTCCGFSFYDRVCNSILVYEYGDRPF